MTEWIVWCRQWPVLVLCSIIDIFALESQWVMGEPCPLIWYGICLVGITAFYDSWRATAVGGLDLILFYNSKMRTIILFYFIVIISSSGRFVGAHATWSLCVLDICSGLYASACRVMHFLGHCIITTLLVAYMGVRLSWSSASPSLVVSSTCITMIKTVQHLRSMLLDLWN